MIACPGKSLLSHAIVALVLAGTPLAAETFRFTVVGIDCKECAPPIRKALSGVPGVHDAQIDWKAALATVEIPEGFDKAKLKAAIAAIGYEAIFPGDDRTDLSPLPEAERRSLDIASASEGARIDLAKVVVPGKVTLVDYGADWCGPCKLLSARLQHFVKANPDVAVRTVNLGRWDNAAAKQGTDEFGIEALPYLRVYDARGKFVAAITGGSWDEILKAVDKAKGRNG